MKLRVFKCLIVMGGAAVALGCMDVRAVDKGAAPGGSAKVQSAVFGTTHIRPTVRAREGFGEFEVVFPAGGLSAVRRQRVGEEESRQVNFQRAGTELVDQDVETGATYRYEWTIVGNDQITESVEIKIPHDLLIQDDVNLASSEHPFRSGQSFRKVIFSKGTRLITSGQDFRLEADEIHFDGNIIMSWPEGDRASVLDPRKDGGRITVIANQAVGRVRFELRGRHGEDGSDQFAERPDPALRGGKGPAGRNAVTVKRWSSCDGGVVTCASYHCVTDPGDGLPGYRGQTGWKGSPGGRGGDAASLLLKVIERQDLEFTVSSMPGEGGRGGIGSPGGEGGPGGDPGVPVAEGVRFATEPFVNCRAARAGPPGEPGERGPQGDSGVRGRSAQICIVDPQNQRCEDFVE